jgi:hypothetical protein
LLVALYTADLMKHSRLDYKTNAAKLFSILRRVVVEMWCFLLFVFALRAKTNNDSSCHSWRGNSPICRNKPARSQTRVSATTIFVR